jgi:hypothetical protein
VDNDMALKIYIKARATPKVVSAFAERREFDKILIYSKQVNENLPNALGNVNSFKKNVLLSFMKICFIDYRWGTRQITCSSYKLF